MVPLTWEGALVWARVVHLLCLLVTPIPTLTPTRRLVDHSSNDLVTTVTDHLPTDQLEEAPLVPLALVLRPHTPPCTTLTTPCTTRTWRKACQEVCRLATCRRVTEDRVPTQELADTGAGLRGGAGVGAGLLDAGLLMLDTLLEDTGRGLAPRHTVEVSPLVTDPPTLLAVPGVAVPLLAGTISLRTGAACL